MIKKWLEVLAVLLVYGIFLSRLLGDLDPGYIQHYGYIAFFLDLFSLSVVGLFYFLLRKELRKNK